MCGRAYYTYTDEELTLRYLNKKPPKFPGIKPNFNFSPTQLAPIVRMTEGDLTIDLLRWGLIPSWAKDLKMAYSTINARAETVAEKPAFRSAFKARRCLVPLSGFIEWKRDGETKRPFRIFLKDEPIMSVAGIWETWKPERGDAIHSFSIVTTEANALMAKIHDRMPVILSKDGEDAWLSDSKPEELKKLLKPCPAKWMDAVEISTLINSPRNNRPEVLLPLE